MNREITEKDYKNLARELAMSIEDSDYWNGTVTSDDFTLRATLLIYHNKTLYADVAAVWWEVFKDGRPAKGFDWQELKWRLIEKLKQ